MNRANIKDIVLKKGSHTSPEEGLCVMEAVAYIAGEPHSDHPVCTCPVITQFMIGVNDSMNDEERQQLRPYVERLVGTRDGNSAKRLEILVHLTVAQVTPYALRLTALPELVKHAEILEALKLGDYSAAGSAALAAAYAAAYAAYSAADAAAGSAALAAASSAAGSAADAAALAAASSAASSAYAAAYSAAYSAADAAAGVVARSVADAAARKPVWDLVLTALDQALEVGK